MKQTFLRKVILALVVSSLFNCEKDNDTDTITSDTTGSTVLPYFTKRVTKEEISKNLFLNIELEKFKDSKDEDMYKLVYSDDDEFFIDTDHAIYLESTDHTFHSYTFPVIRPDGDETVENLLLSLNDENTYNTYLITYQLTESEKEDIINGVDVDLTDKVILEPITNFDSDNVFNKILYIDETDGLVTCWEADYGISQGTGWEVIDWNEVDCPWDIPGGSGGEGYDPSNPDPSTNGGQVYTTDGGFGAGSGSGSGGPVTSPNILSYEELFLIGFKNSLNGPQRNWMGTHPDLKAEIHLFLLNNIGSSEDIGAIALEIINILISNSNLSLAEAFEQYFIVNPDDFIELLDINQEIPHPLENIDEYLDCFNDGKTAQNYGYTMYVDQPVNGTRKVFNYSTQTPGHTFFTLFKNNTDGTSVNLTIGFYPEDDSYKDLSDWDGPGIFQNNGFPGDEHEYDLYITFDDISDVQFQNIIDDIQTISNSDYDLDDNNCTNVAHNLAVENLGFNMSPTTSLIPILPGAGECINPGDYGEDLRAMSNDSSNPYSDNIGFPIDGHDEAVTSDGPCN